MPKLTQIHITALKDTRVVTARKLIKFIDGANGVRDRPVGQEDADEQEHAISMTEGQQLDLDVRDDQIGYFQSAVDAGEIEIHGMTKGTSGPGPSRKELADRAAGKHLGGKE